MCKYVLYCCHQLITQLQLTNISPYHHSTTSFHSNHTVHFYLSYLPSILIFVHALQPLDLVMTQQLFISMHHHSHLVVECCTKTALPDDNSNDLTACYLSKQQPLSKSSPNALHVCSCHPIKISSPTSYKKKMTIEQITYCTV